MSIRPFDWRDLPALHRYRHQSVFLHSSLVLTRGPMLFSGAMLSALAPSMGVFTSVSVENGDKDHLLIGQAIHTIGSQCAQMTFLTPEEALETSVLPPLLEHMFIQMMERGAFRLLADVNEEIQAFEVLRQSGFAIYARQRIWQLVGQPVGQSKPTPWRAAAERDLIPVRSLYNNLIPALVQQVEPFPAERLHGQVYREGDDLLAYVELKYGHRGIWAQPFVHPDLEDISERLADLLASLPNRRSRPVYLCVRSYQAWLEAALESLGATPNPRQAMMVKHLAIPQKALRALTIPALEGGHPEVTAPISHSQAAPPQNGGRVVAPAWPSGNGQMENH
jgi:hypothetical protein